MPIFRLEKSEDDDMSKAELVIAQETNLELEKHLENWLENSPRQTLVREDFLWIGRQTSITDEDSSTIFSDLLGVDSEGNFVIAELKKGRTPRDVVAQLLDYAAWADRLSEPDIRDIAETYFKTRDEFKGKTFDEAFREVFDLPETDEIPALNGRLRLFIASEEIPARVAHVCRFLRTSHGMDINCIAVSVFQTKLGEVVVSTETIVGDEDFAAPKIQQREHPSSPPRLPSDYPVDQVTWEAVQEFTAGDPNVTFTLKDIEQILAEKYPDLADSSSPRNRIRGSCVNFQSRHSYPIGEDRYWLVKKGIYRLYDHERDEVESDGEAN